MTQSGFQGRIEFGAYCSELEKGAKLVIATYQPSTMEEKATHLNSLVSIPSISPTKFEDSSQYTRLDFISHQKYGYGFVEEIVSPSKIRVFFQEGSRILELNEC